MQELIFTVAGIPIAQGSKIAYPRQRRDGTTAVNLVESNRVGLNAWRDHIAWCASWMMPQGLLDGPLRLNVDFWMPHNMASVKDKRLWHSTKPDLDKLIRAVCDAMTGVVYRDDSQIAVVTASKRYVADGAEPCAVITIRRLDVQ